MRVSTVLIVTGAAIAVVGVLLRFFPALFSWFGNLPGDIRIEEESSRVFIPITSMIVVSVVVTVVLNVISRVWGNR